MCGLRTRISADPDLQIFLRTVRGSAKQTYLRTRTICGYKATSIVCRTNLKRKCQCTSSQQLENWSIFGHCNRLCKKACLTEWGPAGPSRATAGPGKKLSWAPITPSPPPFCMYWDRDTEREERWGEVYPHHPTMGLGERRKLTQRGPERSPGQKWILCIF